MTAVSAFSAVRRGSRKLGKYEPMIRQEDGSSDCAATAVSRPPRPQLRDRQIDLAGPGLPRPLAIAVPVVGALGAARPGRRAGELVDLGGHQALGAVGQQLADEIGVVGLLDQLHQSHLVASGVS